MGNNFLQVNILVPADNVTEFVALTQQFFDEGGFSSVGWKLAGAYRSCQSFRTEPISNLMSAAPPSPAAEPLGGALPAVTPARSKQPTPRSVLETATEFLTGGHLLLFPESPLPRLEGPIYSFVNLWQMPDGSGCDLSTVMLTLADDTTYNSLDDLVRSETQNYVWRVNAPDQPNLHPRGEPGDTYCRITRRIKRTHLGEYAFNSGAVVPIYESHGWRFLGGFQNVTGRLNTFTELWQVPSAENVEETQELLHDNYFCKSTARSTVIGTLELFTSAGYWTPGC